MIIDPRVRDGYIETARRLKGSERRLFMARVVRRLGPGGQRYAEREFGWNRATIRKGFLELDSGRLIRDNFSARGRKSAEENLPDFLADVDEIIRTHGLERLESREVQISCARIRALLIAEKGYADSELPTVETIRKKVHRLGYQFNPDLLIASRRTAGSLGLASETNHGSGEGACPVNSWED